MPLIVGIDLYPDGDVVLGGLEVEINSTGAKLGAMVSAHMPLGVVIANPDFGLRAVCVSLP